MIDERHRHRYEFNCLYEKALTDKGLEIVGRSLDGKFVEIIELPTHPWYVAVQFHPEFKSKPLKPHPLFAGFVEASHRHKLAAAAAGGGVRGRVTGVLPIQCWRASRPRRRTRWCSSPGPASSRARRTPSRRRSRSATSRGAPACRSSSRPRTTRRTARPARSFRGPGLRRGCASSAACATAAGVPILTDIHEPAQADARRGGRRRPADSRRSSRGRPTCSSRRRAPAAPST